ncbi:MAG: energy-coupling factor transporter transmembrane protein EcfT [Candidatus Zixiibacteriota bacterium]|nr:MAG: energy-coupling factor transporter transmembrane protein EcfT [candidate division Zixibacteria bacterium]
MIVMLLLVVALAVSGVRGSVLWRSIRPMLYVVIITLGYHLLFGRDGGRVLVTIAGWSLSTTRLSDGLFFSLRLLVFVSVAFLLTLTSTPSGIAEGFTRLLSPLRRLKVPVNDIGLMVFIALRFVPILAREFVDIRNAQMMRGVRFEGPWRQRARRSLAILIPVFVAALNRADDLAVAIQARGYRSELPRTWYASTRFGVNDWLFSLITSAGVYLLYRVT